MVESPRAFYDNLRRVKHEVRETSRRVFLFPGVDIRELIEVASRLGYTRIYHMYAAYPQDHLIVGSGIGELMAIVSDGQFTLPMYCRNFGLISELQIEYGTYVAHVKKPGENEDQEPDNERFSEAQIVIISNHRAKEMRRIVKEVGPGITLSIMPGRLPS